MMRLMALTPSGPRSVIADETQRRITPNPPQLSPTGPSDFGSSISLS
jgi:hypothetical protein